MAFPLDQETITPLADGEDFMEADNVNKLSTKVANIVSFLGPAGNAQTKSVALAQLFKYQFNEVPKITWIDADTIQIEAKVIAMWSSNNYVIKQNAAAIQIKLSANLDTGAEAASTFYNVFLCGDTAGSTYTAVFSVSATPTGYTYYKLIGRVYNNASSNIPAGQVWNVGVAVPPQSVIKAWINFNGTGTIAINDSYNVSTIDDNGVGNYTINWDTDFANDDYACVGIAQFPTMPGYTYIKALAVGSAQIGTSTAVSDNTPTDTNPVCVIAIGDQ